MSCEIYISDLPPLRSMKEVPHDHIPKPIGSRDSLVSSILEVLPMAERVDNDWLFVKEQGMDLSIQFHMENSEQVRYMVVHIHDHAQGAVAVAALLKHLGLRGHDTSTGELFDADDLEESL